MKRLIIVVLSVVHFTAQAAAQESEQFKLVSDGAVDVTVEFTYKHAQLKDIHSQRSFTHTHTEHKMPIIKEGRELVRIRIFPKTPSAQMPVNYFMIDHQVLDELKKGAFLFFTFNKDTHSFELTRKNKPTIEELHRIKRLEDKIAALEQQLEDCRFQLLYGHKEEEKRKTVKE